jgi:hypothetical protein
MATKAAKKKGSAGGSADFTAVFEALKSILTPYAGPDMRVVHDTPEYYYLDTTFPVYRGKPIMFAAVRRGKAYVSYHLLPLYMNPPLNSHISAELKRRKQGKACFNFTSPDPKLLGELAELTRLGLDCFKKLAKSQASERSEHSQKSTSRKKR